MKVLIAVEDATFGEALADFVVKHQWPPSTDFKVVHVLEPIGIEHLSDVSYLPFLEDVSREAEKVSAALIRHVGLKIRDAFKTTHVEEEVVKGKAREKLLEIAESWPADLVIVGSHGRSGVNRFLLGSVSDAVVSHAPCSVIVIRIPAAKVEESEKEQPSSKPAQMVLRT